MSIPLLQCCPGTLAEGFTTYSPSCLRAMFSGKKVTHILPYAPPQQSEWVANAFIENRTRISISGVQEKLSLLLEKNQLRLTNKGESGTYLLKPIPRDLKQVDQVPANEHLTMQIAKQVYGLKTAENALIFFENGSPTYITKRFDVKADGTHWGKEDFATLAGKSKGNVGAEFKYNYSYEEIGQLIQEYVPAWRVEIEKYFLLVLFNFLYSNGDAHLKNFSLLESPKGDYVLSPAYDLINTNLHVDDTDFALDKGLFADGHKSGDYLKNGHPSKNDFKTFALRIGVANARIEKLMQPFLDRQPKMEALVARSFLEPSNQRGYIFRYNTKRNYLVS